MPACQFVGQKGIDKRRVDHGWANYDRARRRTRRATTAPAVGVGGALAVQLLVEPVLDGRVNTLPQLPGHDDARAQRWVPNTKVSQRCRPGAVLVEQAAIDSLESRWGLVRGEVELSEKPLETRLQRVPSCTDEDDS